MAQVAGEDGLVPTLGTRVVLGQQWDQTEVGGLGLGRAHAVSILSVMAQPWRGENGDHRLRESTHDRTKPSHHGQAGGHLPLGLSRPWGVTKEGALKEGVSGEGAETKGSCIIWGAHILPPREPLRCPDPCSGCLWVPGEGRAAASQGRDLNFGVGWSWGQIPALTLTGVTWRLAGDPWALCPGGRAGLYLQPGKPGACWAGPAGCPPPNTTHAT